MREDCGLVNEKLRKGHRNGSLMNYNYGPLVSSRFLQKAGGGESTCSWQAVLCL